MREAEGGEGWDENGEAFVGLWVMSLFLSSKFFSPRLRRPHSRHPPFFGNLHAPIRLNARLCASTSYPHLAKARNTSYSPTEAYNIEIPMSNRKLFRM